MHESISSVITWTALILPERDMAKSVLNGPEQVWHENIRIGGVTYECIMEAYAMIGVADEASLIPDEIAR